MQEPMLGCKKCGFETSFAEGARLQMRCQNCGSRLEIIEEENSIENSVDHRNSSVSYQSSTTSQQSDDPIHVAELWLPAHNETDEPAYSQFISSLPCPLSLEYLGVGSRRSMLVRGTLSSLKHVAGMIVSAWPSAYLQILDVDPLDEAHNDTSVEKFSVNISLEEPGYLPLRTWLTFLKGDPVHNILSATLGLNSEERLWLQVINLEKGEPLWLRDVKRRLKFEEQRGFVVNEGNVTATSVNAMPIQQINYKQGFTFVAYIFLALFAALIGIFKGWIWFILASCIAVALGYGLYKLTQKKPDEWYEADLTLIRQKVVQQDSFFKTAIRASVWAKDEARARVLLQRVLSSLSQYTLSGGNRLSVANEALKDTSPWPIKSLLDSPEGKFWGWLSPVELGGFWHPPVNNDRVSPGLIPVRGIEVRAPDPDDVKGFYEIGKYFRPDGVMEPVMVSNATLRHNTFLIGKPGVGKTNLMEHLVLAGLEDPEQPAIVVIDPHGDMASRLIGSIPERHLRRIVLMDIGDQEQILTYNPLDVHSTGWDVDQTSQLIVDIGRSLWSDFWGPRMQIPLQRAVQVIAAANSMRPQDKALGLSLLAGLLNATHDSRKRFMDVELEGSEYKSYVSKYFNGDFKNLSNTLREQIIQPVLSKGYRFEESPMLEYFSSPSSKLKPAEILTDRKILIVNTRMSRYGSELSDFVGSLIVNVLMREITRQGEANKDRRSPVLLAIDEFQTFTKVPWQELVAQLRKYGGRTILGTQSLASLRVDDPTLVGIIMSGVRSVFGFLMNGEDAKYMSENELNEKDGGPSMSTLTSLEPFRCYARTVRPDGRLTRPYYFVAAPPAEIVPGQEEKVLEARKAYCIDRDTAKKEAVEGLMYLDRYCANILSGGAAANLTGKKSGSASTAANVLRKGSLNNQAEQMTLDEINNQHLSTGATVLDDSYPEVDAFLDDEVDLIDEEALEKSIEEAMTQGEHLEKKEKFESLFSDEEEFENK